MATCRTSPIQDGDEVTIQYKFYCQLLPMGAFQRQILIVQEINYNIISFYKILKVGEKTKMSAAFHLSEGIAKKYPKELVYIHIPYFVSSTASVLSLAALTMDRFWAITSPLSYRTKLNPNRTAFIAGGIWTFSLSFPFIYLLTGYLTYAFVFAHTVIITTFLLMLYTYVKYFACLRIRLKSGTPPITRILTIKPRDKQSNGNRK